MNKEKEKLAGMELPELKKYLTEARLKLANLKLDWRAGKLSRYHEIIKEKKKIAFCLTFMNGKKLEGGKNK